MAMLLRTSRIKLSLIFKIICVLSVTVTYLILGFSTKGLNAKVSQKNSQLGITRRSLLSVENDTNCTPPAILEFPSDGMTRTQRQHGWIVLHALIACYLFVLLAIVCEEYFIPTIKILCTKLDMKEDIAGATFMATASSCAELFINCVGTFVTEGDIGVGTIVGSAVFNILAVPACCGLFARMVVNLEWWSITRDSVIYTVSVILLICFLEDGKITMYEALTLVSVYIFYILLMYFNNRLNSLANKLVRKCKKKGYYTEIIGETHPLLIHSNGKYIGNGIDDLTDSAKVDKSMQKKKCESDLEKSTNIWEWADEGNCRTQLWWVLTWPIFFILYITTPDCRKYPRLYPLTFLMCIFWIGATSYVVAWLITAIGDTLDIPDSVMGLTFLAAGTSVPEAVSSVIVTNQGHGGMGLSSSIGSNTFDILLCLGLPWLVKSAFYPKVPGNHWIIINSSGINYSAFSLLSTIVILYLTLAINKFKLDWKVGLTCLLMYLMFLCFATLVELNIFFPVNLPTCDR